MRKWIERVFRYAATIMTLSVMGCLWAQHTVTNAALFLAYVASCAAIWTVWVSDNFKYEVEIYMGSALIYQKKFLSKKQQQAIIDLLLQSGATRMENV